MTTTWVDVAPASPWGVHNLPYGIAGIDAERTVVVRIGGWALDVGGAAEVLAPDLTPLLRTPTLNALMAAGPDAWARVRSTVRSWLTDQTVRSAAEAHLQPVDGLEMHLPFEVADYVDFYSSRHHAENIGALFRPDQASLTPNWLHLPIGYHGRSGTVVVSGTEVVRPSGQAKPPSEPAPRFGPSARLDIEAEVGFVVGVPSTLGAPVGASDFAQHVFGVVLVNDWSARDLQAWEYVPLGPFLGKSFATSVSAWVTPLDALLESRVDAPPRDVPVLAYLEDGGGWGLDIDLTVELNGEEVSSPPFAPMYWTAAHQLAHMTVNGASLRTGDLFASGTVSGPGERERGSFIELSWNGATPLSLGDGTSRTFLQDGDEVVLTGVARRSDGPDVALGEVRGRILPAPEGI